MSRWSAGAVGVLVVLSAAACSHGKASSGDSPSAARSSAASTSASPTSSAQTSPAATSQAGTGSPSAGAEPAASAGGASASSATPSASSSAGCSNAEGGRCLGPLPAGTYQTTLFSPQIHYRLPKGWGNFEDTPGNFLLIPPGGDLAGVNPGSSDYVGVYSGVAAASSDCTTDAAAPEVGTTPAKIAAHWTALSTVTASKPRPVTVGGLHGVVLDLTPNLSSPACKDQSSPYGYQSLLFGVGPASLNHGLIKGLHLRVYLLTEPDDSTLAIEIDDVHGGARIAAYSKVAEALKFGR